MSGSGGGAANPDAEPADPSAVAVAGAEADAVANQTVVGVPDAAAGAKGQMTHKWKRASNTIITALGRQAKGSSSRHALMMHMPCR